MRKFQHQRGATLIEVIIIVMLLILLIMLTNVGLKILTEIRREGSRIQTTRDVTVFLYNLSKEVRNAKTILFISSDTLRFTTYDFSKGYDVAQSPNNLYNPLKISTLTYTCLSSGSYATLQREKLSPYGNTTTKLFENIISMPLVDEPASYIFSAQPGVTVCPCDYVNIHLRMKPGFYKNAPLDYSIEATMRSFGG